MGIKPTISTWFMSDYGQNTSGILQIENCQPILGVEAHYLVMVRSDQNFGNHSRHARRWAAGLGPGEDENSRKGKMVLIIDGHKAQEGALPADALQLQR